MSEEADIFNWTPPATSTPKDRKRKRLQLSLDFNACSSNQILTSCHSQSVFGATETPVVAEISATNKDVMDMLEIILQKQTNLETRLDSLEGKMLDKTDVMAHHKVVRESRVLIKKVHQSVCRISGETAKISTQNWPFLCQCNL
ncbi:PREDICTED: uncharacterized protein LOC108361534 [Rhagoletis zephyria]|uniref:uncharacterized protein LOC108361534 n=1 Tax=Rhagoletis zephyria TaxID=28612 RepID=UPI0008112906|nr:PREDICTED: uncharacterized protein LOC108361534 [Rhagoletis zephyria]XP_036344594.1 uncharacterized protein LOC118753830 [Rhagoletis pomonella]XP_036344595.1 uncharacterized protein LOC118753830 [Rhagoletis pomonella]